MASTKYPSTNLNATEFIESAGAVLFHLPSQRVCLVYSKRGGYWVLPKGRRNSGESREAAAIREVTEESGYQCTLLPTTLSTRATPPDDTNPEVPDVPRIIENSLEPFMLAIRDQGNPSNKDMKLVWWFIATIDEGQLVEALRPSPEPTYDVGMFAYKEAVVKLTFERDREIFRRALEVMKATLG